MPIPHRALLPWLVLVVAILENPAWAGWTLALPGRVERVVSAGDHVAVVRGKSVILLHDDGTIMGQLVEPDLDARRKTPSSDEHAREDILDFLGIDESEHDRAWVEDELNNESTLMQRRLRREGRRDRANLRTGSPVLTAGARDIWIANARGLWCWPETGDPIHVTTHALSRSHLSAASDGQVLVATGHQLWLFSVNEGARLLATSAAFGHVAASGSNRELAWTSGSKLELRDGAEDPGRIVVLSQPARALRYCSERLVLLSQDGLTALTPEGDLIALSPRLCARRLACTDGVDPWLAVGPDLLLSADQGHTWTSIAVPVRAQVLDASLGKDALWVATDTGLYRVSGQPSPDPPLTADPTSPSQPRLGPGLAPWWAAWLPQITVAGGALLARGRRDIQTVALASFPLDAPTRRRSFRLVADNSEVPVPHESRPLETTLPTDPDAACLELARSKAVTLAMVEPDRARSYVDRARHAAWLPELRLRVDRRFGRSESLDVPSTSTSTTSPLGVDTVDDVRYEARVTWDLARLVFSNDELAAQAQTMHMAEMRRDIEITVSRLYFERRRIRLERLSAASPDRSVRRELRFQEIEAELDALTGGSFSQCTAQRMTGQGAS